MATEPEYPTGKLGQSGVQTEWAAAALCPSTALQCSPSAPRLGSGGKGRVPRGGLSPLQEKANHRQLRQPSPHRRPHRLYTEAGSLPERPL